MRKEHPERSVVDLQILEHVSGGIRILNLAFRIHTLERTAFLTGQAIDLDFLKRHMCVFSLKTTQTNIENTKRM